MTAREKVEAEVAKFNAILAVKGGLWDDQKERFAAMRDVLAWMQDEKDEADRIELEAMEAEEAAAANDPSNKVRELFKGVHIKIPPKGK
jgi:hypothetical protein